jgi:DNA (cytosine-5)-methyltransferase 1
MAIRGGTLTHFVDPFIFQSLPAACTVDAVMETVQAHLFNNLIAAGRHSVLLVYTLYSLQMDSDRSQDKFLLPLRDPEGLTHGFVGVGDLALSGDNGDLFGCIQIVGVLLTPALIKEAFAQVSPYAPRRFCLLTTAGVCNQDREALRQTCDSIYRTSGCEVIVDSLMSTLNYGVRSLPEPTDFLAAYRQALRENATE